MRELLISVVTVISIAVITYLSYSQDGQDLSDNPSLRLSQDKFLINENLLKKFDSGISIKDLGDIVIIEQKLNNASIIINKENLEDIIVFLNNSSE